MADNVTVTAGFGTTISTEEVTTLNGGAVSAQHIQRIVPAFRTADGTASDWLTGAGVVSAAVPRVVLASDDLAVLSLGILDDLVLTEDAAHSSGAKGVMPLAVRSDAGGTLAGTDGDYAPLQVDANGALRVTGGGGGTQYAEDAAHSTGATGTLALVVRQDTAAQLAGTDGDYSVFITDATGRLWCHVGTIDGGTITTVTTLTGSGVAHDAADSGNPHKIGGKAIAHGANPTAVAAADRTDWYFNRAGVPFIIGGHPNVISHAVRVADADGAQTNVAFVSVGAGAKIVVTRVTVTADGSNTGPVNVTVGFAAATLATPNTTTGGAGILADFQGVPAGGGANAGDGSGILGVGADAEDLRYTCEDPAGGAITITVSYYTIES